MLLSLKKKNGGRGAFFSWKERICCYVQIHSVCLFAVGFSKEVKGKRGCMNMVPFTDCIFFGGRGDGGYFFRWEREFLMNAT